MLVSWDEWNVEHIDEHGMSPAEAEHVVKHAEPPFPRPRRGSQRHRLMGP
jgi:hypothetical protein